MLIVVTPLYILTYFKLYDLIKSIRNSVNFKYDSVCLVLKSAQRGSLSDFYCFGAATFVGKLVTGKEQLPLYISTRYHRAAVISFPNPERQGETFEKADRTKM